MTVQPGDVVAGKFRIERVLGEGGMGIVYEATHLKLDERVALKFLKSEALTQPDQVARFAQEARAAAKLKSEHVARVLDVGEESSVPYMVMEYLQGKNLEELLVESGPFSIAQAVDLVIQATEGIAEAHARGIVHRDVKPANLFLTEAGDGWSTLKILDFGISKALLQKVPLKNGPRTVSILGSPYYMSPEQLCSTRDVDRRTDLWALGAVLYELICGRTPFNATEFVPLVNDILKAPHTPLLELCPHAPPALGEIIDRALAKDVTMRFQSAGELARALLPFAKNERSRVVAARAVDLTRKSGIDPSLPLLSASPPSSTSGAAVDIVLPRPPRVPSLAEGLETLQVPTPLTSVRTTNMETPDAKRVGSFTRTAAAVGFAALAVVNLVYLGWARESGGRSEVMIHATLPTIGSAIEALPASPVPLAETASAEADAGAPVASAMAAEPAVTVKHATAKAAPPASAPPASSELPERLDIRLQR